MERASERRAFARAWSYLNYNAAAKWAALIAAVAAGVLYVLLLVVLWLFGDLMVHRGQIAAFDELTAQEQKAFDQKWQDLGESALDLVGLTGGRAAGKALASVEPSNPQLTSQEQRFLWRLYLVRLLHEHVGGVAAMQVLPAFRDLADSQKQEVVRQWMNTPESDRSSRLVRYGF